jgi:hypothetical protein
MNVECVMAHTTKGPGIPVAQLAEGDHARGRGCGKDQQACAARAVVGHLAHAASVTFPRPAAVFARWLLKAVTIAPAPAAIASSSDRGRRDGVNWSGVG